jgi:hypothetical protein
MVSFPWGDSSWNLFACKNRRMESSLSFCNKPIGINWQDQLTRRCCCWPMRPSQKVRVLFVD